MRKYSIHHIATILVFEKNALGENCVSGIVLKIQLMQNYHPFRVHRQKSA
jgi:hypothetical protein